MKSFEAVSVFCILSFGFTLKIESGYNKVFEYGDRNTDGKITREEIDSNPNMAYKLEWNRYWNRIPQEIIQDGITKEELRDMSIRGGINYF